MLGLQCMHTHTHTNTQKNTFSMNKLFLQKTKMRDILTYILPRDKNIQMYCRKKNKDFCKLFSWGHYLKLKKLKTSQLYEIPTYVP